MQFQSTLPEWAATAGTDDTAPMTALFQSTLPEWAATYCFVPLHCEAAISIHAARVGSDQIKRGEKMEKQNISIHAARVGSDRLTKKITHLQKLFQSTLPEWAATKTY